MSLQKSLRETTFAHKQTDYCMFCAQNACWTLLTNGKIYYIFLLLYFYRQSISHFIEPMCWRQQTRLEYKSLRERDWKSDSASSRVLSAYEWAHHAVAERRDPTCAHAHTHIHICVYMYPCILKLGSL